METEQKGLVLAAYRFWSEEFYAAGFMTPDHWGVKRFMEYMQSMANQPLESYEQAMLDIYEEIRSLPLQPKGEE